MRHALKLHPDSRCLSVARIEVDIARPRAGHLTLHYVVTGKIGDLALPFASAPARTDGLWEHTCFEAFVRPTAGAAYTEFNFAPSTQWAAYRFSGYRAGATAADEIGAPDIYLRTAGERLDVTAAFAFANVACRLGLSAVIEEVGGVKSYWALAHGPGKPDFHHDVAFAIDLPAL